MSTEVAIIIAGPVKPILRVAVGKFNRLTLKRPLSPCRPGTLFRTLRRTTPISTSVAVAIIRLLHHSARQGQQVSGLTGVPLRRQGMGYGEGAWPEGGERG